MSNLADLLADAARDFEGARTHDSALKAEPGNDQARLNRAVLHLLTGNLKDGWRDYAARIELPGKVPLIDKARPEHRLAAWTGGSLKKNRLLVRAEQGVGDQIMFASCFGDLAQRAAQDGSVLIESEPRLTGLFARSFPNCTVQPATWKSGSTGVIADYGWLKSVGGANAVTLMGTLYPVICAAPSSFPAPHAYLKPDADEQSRWRRTACAGMPGRPSASAGA